MSPRSRLITRLLIIMTLLIAAKPAIADITVTGISRYAHQWHWESDTITGTNEQFFGPYGSLSGGAFSYGNAYSNHAGIGLASLDSSFSHSSMLIASATALSLTGTLQSAVSAAAFTDGWNLGGAQWSIRTQVDLLFNVNEPTYFHLQANTLMGDDAASSRAAFVGLGHSGTFSSPGPSAPDIAAYGKSLGSAGSNAWGITSPFASGNIQGWLSAGDYEFHAIVYESFTVSPGETYADSRLASFNLSLSSVPEPTALLPVGFLIISAIGCIRRR